MEASAEPPPPEATSAEDGKDQMNGFHANGSVADGESLDSLSEQLDSASLDAAELDSEPTTSETAGKNSRKRQQAQSEASVQSYPRYSQTGTIRLLQSDRYSQIVTVRLLQSDWYSHSTCLFHSNLFHFPTGAEAENQVRAPSPAPPQEVRNHQGPRGNKTRRKPGSNSHAPTSSLVTGADEPGSAGAKKMSKRTAAVS